MQNRHSHRLVLEAYGVFIELDLDPAIAVAEVLGSLPYGLRPVASAVDPTCRLTVRISAGRWTVSGSGGILCEAAPQGALQCLEDELYRCLMLHPPRHVMVHAGVVGWRGRGVVFPGTSHSGKTTLALALTRAGAQYYSDDLAVFDGDGRVHPYARPLLLRTEGRRVSAPALGLTVGEGPLEVAMVVLTDYSAGARWRPRAVQPGDGLVALLAHTPVSRLEPARVMATLRRVVERAVVVRSQRAEAGIAAHWLLSHERLQAP